MSPTMREKREKDEAWDEVQRRYHENRRKAEDEGDVAPVSSAQASDCCNAGVFWTRGSVICKECGEVQE